MCKILKKNIAVFASGRGSNAQKIIEKQNELSYKVVLLVCNNKNALALELARQNGIETLVLDRNEFYNTGKIISDLKNHKVDFLVLAGFMWLVPSYLIEAFSQKIINIHPSLLPKYGGKGMYGMNVHNAVFLNEEKESGITIHEVNAEYDKGKVLLQKKIALEKIESAENISASVLELEHEYFAKTISEWVDGKFKD